LNYYEQMVGARIKSKRVALGLKQEHLAAKVCTDQSRVSRWENGHALPDPEFRPSLLKELGLTEAGLFGIDSSHLPASPPKTIADMTPADLEALVARASKRDGTINFELGKARATIKELEDQINLLPGDFWTVWKKVESPLREAFLFFVTGNVGYLEGPGLPEGLSRALKNFRRDLLDPD
jgi:transcriptional regulator with XRE-family HTH domain